jgi:ribonuclease Z
MERAKKTFLEVFPMEHTKDVTSVGFKICESRTKLKEEYLGLNQREIQRVIAELGKENITYIQEKPIVVYSGDGKPASKRDIEGCEILFHESTFLKSEDRKGQLHSTIDEVMELVENSGIKRVILYHFSSRYTGEQISKKIRELKVKLPNNEINFITPGKIFVVD